jgi:hypothetical protein
MPLKLAENVGKRCNAGSSLCVQRNHNYGYYRGELRKKVL